VSDVEKSRLVAWNREMRAVHSRLREILQLVRTSLDAPELPARELLLYCHGFCVALSRHHLAEDAVLFPELSAQHPDLGDTIRRLQQDHSMIAHLITQLEHTVATAGSAEQLALHVEGIGAIMESHFRYEERQLLGILEALEVDQPIARMLGEF
jgi:hemerythrin-like domain-containing protein